MTEERKSVGRNELRRRLRELQKERDEILERLESTAAELKLHAAWCQIERPSWLRRQFNRFWVWLTERATDPV